MEKAFRDYFKALQKLDLISKVFLGIDKESNVYVVNVFQQETAISDCVDPKYAEMTSLGGVLVRSLRQHVSLYVSYLNTSKVEEFKQRCQKSGLEIQEVLINLIVF